MAPTDSTVLICGESGCGKELVAESVHAMSPRADKPFVAINCAAIPATLIEAELFGHERGSFTGALRTREGVFERANGGTLLLDEITEMPLDLQSRLLRVLETKQLNRVGGSAICRSTFASSPPPIACRRRPSRKAGCARTSTTAWPS